MDLHSTCLGADGVAALRDLPLLKALDLSDPLFSFCEDVQEELRRLPLTDLKLSGINELTDKSLERLREMPLKLLDLSGCGRITGEGLEFLRGMPLTSLSLENCRNVLGLGRLE